MGWKTGTVGDLTVGHVARGARVRVRNVNDDGLEVAGPLRAYSAGPFGGGTTLIGKRTLGPHSIVVHLTISTYELMNLDPRTPCEVFEPEPDGETS